jgi:hypothetical protein
MRRSQRDVVFEVSRGRLVRHVRLKDGRGYSHRCTLDVLDQVAHLVEARREAGVTTTELWEALSDLACTQISVALEFLKDRGCVAVEGRRTCAASATLTEVRHRAVGRRAVLLQSRNWVVTAAEADRLAAAGVSFAYLCEHVTPDGQYGVMTVPVN